MSIPSACILMFLMHVEGISKWVPNTQALLVQTYPPSLSALCSNSGMRWYEACRWYFPDCPFLKSLIQSWKIKKTTVNWSVMWPFCNKGPNLTVMTLAMFKYIHNRPASAFAQRTSCIFLPRAKADLILSCQASETATPHCCIRLVVACLSTFGYSYPQTILIRFPNVIQV